ncbi:MAG: tRNA-dihydrouridine synthase family protein [Acidobacteriota bacterium]|nr:tRNA-dihydrouridine synthase family protein [Acidobacteriota bacterium]
MNAALSPLRLGPLTIDFPVVLAALAGYSDLPYRTICRELGAPFATTEVMLDKFLLQEGKLRRHLLRSDAGDHPVGGQIMGADPAIMARAAVILRDLGFDAIDLNFACPVKKVVSRKRGGHMMADPEGTLEVIRAVRDAVPDRPLMIKLRKSFALGDEACEAFWTISRGAWAAGADAICVHARAVGQMYKGQADWAFLRRVKEAFPDRTIIGSGDVRTPADALRMFGETGVDGIAAARGAIGNPWFFRQVGDLASGREMTAPTLAEQRAVMERHFALAVELYGEQKATFVMRHFGISYGRMHPHAKRIRMAFVAVRSAAEWRAVLDEHYAGETVPAV